MEAGWPAGTTSGAGSALRMAGMLRDAMAGRARVHAVPGAHRADASLVRVLGRASEGPIVRPTVLGLSVEPVHEPGRYPCVLGELYTYMCGTYAASVALLIAVRS